MHCVERLESFIALMPGHGPEAFVSPPSDLYAIASPAARNAAWHTNFRSEHRLCAAVEDCGGVTSIITTSALVGTSDRNLPY